MILTMKQGNVAGREPGRQRPAGAGLLRARGPPHGRQPARAAAAHRPVARIDDARRRRLVVAELSPYEADLDWSEITEPDEIGPVLADLGRATAKVHCISDADSDEGPRRVLRPRRRSPGRVGGDAGRVRRGHRRLRDRLRGTRAARPRAVRGRVPRRALRARVGDLSASPGRAANAKRTPASGVRLGFRWHHAASVTPRYPEGLLEVDHRVVDLQVVDLHRARRRPRRAAPAYPA